MPSSGILASETWEKLKSMLKFKHPWGIRYRAKPAKEIERPPYHSRHLRLDLPRKRPGPDSPPPGAFAYLAKNACHFKPFPSPLLSLNRFFRLYAKLAHLSPVSRTTGSCQWIRPLSRFPGEMTAACTPFRDQNGKAYCIVLFQWDLMLLFSGFTEPPAWFPNAHYLRGISCDFGELSQMGRWSPPPPEAAPEEGETKLFQPIGTTE